MNSEQVRQSFFEFFQSRGHTLVHSSSLKPNSPNLLFTNAGMNQFVPYFLGERTPDTRRVVDTQKCIRAGGKHNDLDDVGFDTYHHTFFEMLGNWSFGDFFKKEIIPWAWELLVKVWNFPKDRLYVTVYRPAEGEPAGFDQEAYDVWKNIMLLEGLDPKIHIKYGGKRDNFWMMGDTGPCGPCSEIHIDLTPNGDTKGELVNTGSPWCIELWNLVFMQFNALPDGQFIELPKFNVDTGMGLERVAGILAKTKNFTDFSGLPSNYDSDLFSDIFHAIGDMSGCQYNGTTPKTRSNLSKDEQIDFAFRVIADHMRALTFAIADGIFPSNEGRGYVLRRILRRAVTFCNNLKIPTGALAKLSEVVVDKMVGCFPELKKESETIYKVIYSEELSFRRTLDRGLEMLDDLIKNAKNRIITGKDAFLLYDTYGFPLDLTQLIAEEHGCSIDVAGFDAEMDKQRTRARAAQKKSDILVSDNTNADTRFIGYDLGNNNDCLCKVIDVLENGKFLVLDKTPFYAECGGQASDSGYITCNDKKYTIKHVSKSKNGQILHELNETTNEVKNGNFIIAHVDEHERLNASRNHTATHILHWALRKVLGSHVNQAGSSVDPKRLRFDFNHFEAMTSDQVKEVEKLVQEKVLSCENVVIYETEFNNKPADCIANFDEKYGDIVRVVKIGDFFTELCGGCHVSNSSEICLFKIISESSIAAGIRRIEAVTGDEACILANKDADLIDLLSKKMECGEKALVSKINDMINENHEFSLKIREIRNSELKVEVERLLTTQTALENGVMKIEESLHDFSADELRNIASMLSKKLPEYVLLLTSKNENKNFVVVMCSDLAVKNGYCAGDLVKELCSKHGGKGGGNKTFAMGGF